MKTTINQLTLCLTLVSLFVVNATQAHSPVLNPCKYVNAAVAVVTEKGFPVKYISFSASVSPKSVILSWVTEESANTTHAEVERSFDGKSFSMIGMSLDGFEDGANKNYAYKDNITSLGGQTVAYYRLKQVALDGNFIYSNVIKVDVKNNANPVM